MIEGLITGQSLLDPVGKRTNTKVTVPAGDEVGISADGQVTVSPAQTAGPAGDPSCTPAQNYPGRAFPAPSLPSDQAATLLAHTFGW